MTHYQVKRLQGWIEEKLEHWMDLEINREKTRVVDLRKEGERIDFLGYTFRRDRDLRGRGHRYLNVFPSKKSVARERARIQEMTSSRNCFKPVSLLVGELNRQIYGWGNYFRFGYYGQRFGRSIGMYGSGCQFIYNGVASGPFEYRKGARFTSTWTVWDWCICEEFEPRNSL